MFKESLFKTTACKGKNPLRYFTKDEIYKLFELVTTTESETHDLMMKLHKDERVSDPVLDQHIKDIEKLCNSLKSIKRRSNLSLSLLFYLLRLSVFKVKDYV